MNEEDLPRSQHSTSPLLQRRSSPSDKTLPSAAADYMVYTTSSSTQTNVELPSQCLELVDVPLQHAYSAVQQSSPRQTTGRPRTTSRLSSVISNPSEQSLVICRICHEGDNMEELISPCNCSGSMAMCHRSCMEKWLATCNGHRCEICMQEFIILRTPRPFTDWLRRPTKSSDKRNLIGDCACFVLLTPLAAVSAWLCITGAMHFEGFSQGDWESIGLITLSIFLLLVYAVWCAVQPKSLKPILAWFCSSLCNTGSLFNEGFSLADVMRKLFIMLTIYLILYYAMWAIWCAVAVRYHCRVYNEWKSTNQVVSFQGALAASDENQVNRDAGTDNNNTGHINLNPINPSPTRRAPLARLSSADLYLTSSSPPRHSPRSTCTPDKTWRSPNKASLTSPGRVSRISLPSSVGSESACNCTARTVVSDPGLVSYNNLSNTDTSDEMSFSLTRIVVETIV